MEDTLQPIPISEFRRNTKLYLDIAKTQQILISRDFEVFALRSVHVEPVIKETIRTVETQPDWGA